METLQGSKWKNILNKSLLKNVFNLNVWESLPIFGSLFQCWECLKREPKEEWKYHICLYSKAGCPFYVVLKHVETNVKATKFSSHSFTTLRSWLCHWMLQKTKPLCAVPTWSECGCKRQFTFCHWHLHLFPKSWRHKAGFHKLFLIKKLKKNNIL